VLTAAAVLLLAAAAAVPALGAVPSPANCTVQEVIIGGWTGVGIPTCLPTCGPKHGELFLVTVRDGGNNPIPGATVKVFFSAAGVRVHAAQNAGIALVCPGDEVGAIADASGTVKMSVRFAGHTDAAAVSVFAQGVLLAMIPARSPDYDGDGRVSLADFSVFSADYLDPLAGHPRSDFDNCPTTKLPDLAFFAAEYAASNLAPPAPLCP
jgi:hypothetical protein